MIGRLDQGQYDGQDGVVNVRPSRERDDRQGGALSHPECAAVRADKEKIVQDEFHSAVSSGPVRRGATAVWAFEGPIDANSLSSFYRFYSFFLCLAHRARAALIAISRRFSAASFRIRLA